MIRITCAILCYNYGRFLSQAIESCLNQTPGDYELDILVIDDGSTDETPEVCARYASRIRVVRSPNEGFGPSLTKAILLAEGDYVCLLDADDYFRPDKIVTILPSLKSHPLLILHMAYQIDELGHLLDNKSHPCPTSALCLRRDAALTLLPVENEVYFMPLDLPNASIRLEEPLTYYRVHSGSMQRNPIPGIWQLQIAAVNRSFITRIDSLLAQPPFWLTATERLLKLKADAEMIAAFSELEASLQLRQRSVAIRKCVNFGRVVLSNRKGGILFGKMILRTVLGIPVFRVGSSSPVTTQSK